MVTLESFTDDTDQVEHMVKWWISRSAYRYHRVRRRGTVRDFINDFWIHLLKNFRDGKQVECSISTAIINHCTWTLSEPVDYGEGERTKRNFAYKMRTARRVKSGDLIDSGEQAELNARGRELQEAIAGVLRSLPIREAAIVRARYGLFGDPELTLEQIGAAIRRSRERIRQLETRGIQRMKHHTLANHLLPYVDDATHKRIHQDACTKLQKSEYGNALFEELMKDES